MKSILSFLILILILSCKPTESKTQLRAENIVLKERIRILEASDTLHTEAAVELQNMNVVYRGVSNPIYISKPNTLSFEAKAPGLTKKDSLGNYNLNPGQGNTIDIEIKSKLKNGDSLTEVKTLRIKDIKPPIGTINNIGCGSMCELKLKKEELTDAIIGAKINEFLFDLNFYVTSFKIKMPHYRTIKIDGNKMNVRANDLFTLLIPNDNIVIFDISVYIRGRSNYRLKKIAPIIIKIIE
ncbi:GldM family protein [Winogradskyella pulchriflava]|uniref:GldM family protein n=1 Tax=Winogradskyella pulchriflava TaxID=1110688 RepID=A0ABV6Q5R0_9FLAO